MATYTWSIPVGNQITGSTLISDTDNFLANTVDDLVDFVNGEGAHSGQGLTYDLVSKTSNQVITGQKTFSSAIIASGGVTGNVIGNVIGNVTGDVAGNSATATKLATAKTISIAGVVNGSASFDGSSNIVIYVGGSESITAIPSGVITLWSGSSSSIPSGWYLCNGLHGTPNLTDRFVIGAGGSYSIGETGGSKDAIAVAHTHTATSENNGFHKHNLWGYTWTAYGGGDSEDGNGTAANYINRHSIAGETHWEGEHYHTITVNSSGSSGTNANMPPYYALCYIMKA